VETPESTSGGWEKAPIVDRIEGPRQKEELLKKSKRIRVMPIKKQKKKEEKNL